MTNTTREILEKLLQCKEAIDEAIQLIAAQEEIISIALKTQTDKAERKIEECEYYHEIESWNGSYGVCWGTKDADPCEGKNCKRWKPKKTK